jgi:hypothetical protein
MMRTSFILFTLFFLVLVSCNRPGKPSATVSEVTTKMPDEEAIKKAVDDAYRSISFKPGQKLNYDSIRYYFIPQAQLLNFRGDSLDIASIDQFINSYKGFVEANKVKAFYEEEIYGRTDQFGKIAQRISTYKSYINTMDSVSERGVNSFQLVKTPSGWRVSSIIWDIEKPGHPIPGYYLNTSGAQ